MTRRVGDFLLLVPKILLTALLILAIGDMLAGVFLRYVVVQITDWLDVDPVNFFWVEELGEMSLGWLTTVGAGIGIAEGAHFTLRVVTHRLPLRWQRSIGIFNHLVIAAFGAVTAVCGTRLAIVNSTLASPALQINLAWLYASAAIGGALIVLYALGTLLAHPAGALHEDLAVAETLAAGDD
ncbi:MAG: TRAP transporter small permease subunit [Alphaproteobacteria bacterium]|nr:TRAP transporter small permease subunit [Alphaproteobacteria bacterium]